MLDRKKDRSVAIQHSLLNRGDLYPLSFFDSRKYIQHNVKVGDGLGHIYAYMDALPRGKSSVTTCRAIEDGDFSVVHNDYRLGDLGPTAAFEVHRWEHDRIVEHWDNLQSMPVEPNPSGRSMTDGATRIEDLEHTDRNKAIIDRFTSEILIDGAIDRLSSYFVDDRLLQHNPRLADGVPALREALEDGGARYATLHRVLGEGNFVLTMSEGSAIGLTGEARPTAFFDLYRLADGKIVEHWDVIETIPPRDEWVHDNGKF